MGEKKQKLTARANRTPQLHRLMDSVVVAHAPRVHALLLSSVETQFLALLRVVDFDFATDTVQAQVLPTHSGDATNHPTAH